MFSSLAKLILVFNQGHSEAGKLAQFTLENCLPANPSLDEYRDAIKLVEYCSDTSIIKNVTNKMPPSVYESILFEYLHKNKNTIITLSLLDNHKNCMTKRIFEAIMARKNNSAIFSYIGKVSELFLLELDKEELVEIIKAQNSLLYPTQ